MASTDASGAAPTPTDPHPIHNGPVHAHSNSTSTLPDTISSPKTNQDLAALLTQAYGENDALRREVLSLKRRAEKAERLAQSLTSAAEGSSSSGATTAAGSSSTANGSSGNTAPPALSETAVRIIRDLEERLAMAEAARDDSEQKRRMLLEHWAQVDGYLGTLEYKAAEARTNFGRVLRDVGPGPGGPTMLPPAPFPSKHSRNSSRSHSIIFPPPGPTSPSSTRRPRTPSMDSTYPPPKRQRGEEYGRYDPAADVRHTGLGGGHPAHAQGGGQMRVIQPGEKFPQGKHTRSSSHSSASSMDVDEMLLRTAVDEGRAPTNGTTPAPLTSQSSTHITSSHRTRAPRSQPLAQARTVLNMEDSQYAASGAIGGGAGGMGANGGGIGGASGSGGGIGGLGGGARIVGTSAYPANQSEPGFGKRRDLPPQHQQQPPIPLQQFNTHVFAPPVTGAPIKKAKYSSSVGNLGGDSPQTQQAVYPAANAAGQRICRQCGQVGRYKEGKCVEKWGPGPMGPGTVCDRCRKKMKRIERRTTQEVQQQAQAALVASLAVQQGQGPGVQQRQPLPTSNPSPLARTDTVPNLSTASNSNSSKIERDQPKESHLRTQSTTATAFTNGRPSSSSKSNPPMGSLSTTTSTTQRSPTQAGNDATTDSDADADAEAEAEAEVEAEMVGAASATTTATTTRGTNSRVKALVVEPEGEVDELGDGDAEADAEVDPEADLLEAVDAAERSTSSGSVA